MPEWSIVISGPAEKVSLEPDPQEVFTGDLVSWSNRTDFLPDEANSQTITIDGTDPAVCKPMIAPSWGSSSPAYQVTQAAGTSVAYTVRPTNDPAADGVKGTIKVVTVIALLLALGSIFAPSLQAQMAAQQDCGVLLGGELKDPPQIDRDSAANQLRGTLSTVGSRELIAFNKPGSGFFSGELTKDNLKNYVTCVPQWLRVYRKGDGMDANQTPNAPATLPVPGPTLRAAVGDLVELTFLNMIDPLNFPGTDTGKCDQVQNSAGAVYPQTDEYPNCFHGSVFTNVHYHGTHTSPNATADNVFLQIVPSPRMSNNLRAPFITADTVKDQFKEFFGQCEEMLKLNNSPQQWPHIYTDLPEEYRKSQNDYLSKAQPKLYANNLSAQSQGAFPQNYIGAFPYCYRLPVYTDATFPPAPMTEQMATHMGGAGSTEHDETLAPKRKLMMGQAPGTHWYHAHKHGSTTLNLSNGMSGVMVIEGQYDQEITDHYKPMGGITEHVILLNQIGVTPRLEGGSAPSPGPYFSANGRLQPVIKMKPGEVQWWRIADASSRSGLILTAPPANGLTWRQLAVDGVQFANARYVESENKEIVLTSGSRADLLVMAPKNGKGRYPFMGTLTTDPITNRSNSQVLFYVEIDTTGTRDMGFMDRSKTYFPPYLTDIKASEVTGHKTITFATDRDPNKPNFSNHTIDGIKFSGEVGALVLLNQTEEWKIENASYAPKIAHPFHIHINPFQITEEFEPNARLSTTAGAGTVSTVKGSNAVTGTGTTFMSTFRVGDFITITGEAVGNVVAIASDTSLTFSNSARGATNAAYTVGIPQYTTNKDVNDRHPNQCYIDPNDKTSWHPCGPTEPPEGDGRKWWDVFSIPSGQNFYTKGSTTPTPIPGYFKLVSRFVDYPGYFVIHCHILSHEDRGMMTVVYVAPLQPPFSHH